MSEIERAIGKKQGQGDGHLGSSQIIAMGRTKLPKHPVLCLFLYRKQKVGWGGDDLHFLFLVMPHGMWDPRDRKSVV